MSTAKAFPTWVSQPAPRLPARKVPPPDPGPDASATVIARFAVALQAAGLDVWSAVAVQACPHLITVQEVAERGYVWLRPHFTPEFAQMYMPTEEALGVINHKAEGRTTEGWATEDEALALWERLHAVGEGAP